MVKGFGFRGLRLRVQGFRVLFVFLLFRATV